ncbi:MAG: hypothetical protein ACOCPN_02520 [Desulfonatronovibrionaceae bacterium]
MILLAMLAFLCLGMSGTGDLPVSSSGDGRLFRATVMDHEKNSYEVENLSVDGSASLPARTGAARAKVDFGWMEKVVFHHQDDRLLARVVLADDKEMDFYIQPDTVFTGQTDWGRISFKAEDIREIHFR